MAIFGFKKRKDEKLEQNASAAKSMPKDKKAKVAKSVKAVKADTKAVAKKAVAPKLEAVADTSVASIIIRPRITEKSGVLSQGGVYTFEVARGANKNSVAKAFTKLYKVNPVKVAVINTPSKNVFVKGRWGVVSGMRKAVVTVKKGDKIDFV